MDDNLIETINKQASGELYGVEFVEINMETTANDYEERSDDSDSDIENDVKSYETSDDSNVVGDCNIFYEPDHLEEDQQY